MLSQANSITAVSDRESDFYELFARRPDNVELIVRACQNRRIEAPAGRAEGLMSGFIDEQPEQGRFATIIPARPAGPSVAASLPFASRRWRCAGPCTAPIRDCRRRSA